MKKIVFYVFIPLVLLACRSKVKSMKGDEEVKPSEFIEFFPEQKFPLKIADTSLVKFSKDSLIVAYKVAKQFIPDTVFTKYFGKSNKLKIYAMGRVREKRKEHYLLMKVANGKKQVGYLLIFNEKDQFKSSMPLVTSGFENYAASSGSVDAKFQIATVKEFKPGTNISYKRNIYIYNAEAQNFTLIMTEPNEDIIEEVINPIDTLPSKQKISGNYVKNKRNFISFRDGKKATEFLFFVHFEKENASCVGELKGIARQTNKNTLQYQEPGNTCALEFKFEGNEVTMKETGGCGAYRDIKCFFEGSYPKKAEPKPARKKRS